MPEKFVLRCYTLLDCLQPQLAAFLGTVVDGDPPIEGMACLAVEFSPGIQVYRFMDMVVKATNVRPGIQVVEREFGAMEVHSLSQADVRQAGRILLTEAGLTEEDRVKPKMISVQFITNISARQAQILNRRSSGALLIPGETLLVLECDPAGYAAYATNEAEKAANIKVIQMEGIGRYGRVLLSGTEEDAMAAQAAAIRALEELKGREA